MLTEISVKRLSTKSVYKIIAVGFLFSWIPFSILMGMAACFGENTIEVNGIPFTGLAGLLISPFVGLILSVVFAWVMGSFAAFGLLLYSKLRPISISFYTSD